MFRSEFKTVFFRRRSALMILCCGLIPFLIPFAIRIAGRTPQHLTTLPFAEQISFGASGTAMFAITLCGLLFVPLITASLCADAIAGEEELGTLKYLLIAPTSRMTMYTAKFLTIFVFSFVAVICIAALGMVGGFLTFGSNGITTMSGTAMSTSTAIARMFCCAIVIAVMNASLIAIGLCVSAMTKRPIVAMFTTLLVAATSLTLDLLPQFGELHSGLFTHYYTRWIDLMSESAMWGAINKGFLIQLAWVIVFVTASWARMTVRDIKA